MYCHDCGTANTVDSKYCKECGIKINDGYRTMMLSVLDLPVNQSEETLDKLTRLLDMAFWHNEAGNRDAAITAAEAALSINPNSTTAHSLLGTLYEKRGDDASAISHFEAVLALNPDSAADAAKLDQLRRGIHVKAVAPPVAHLWLPPGMVRLTPQIKQRWSALTTGSEQSSRALPLRPLFAAGAVALIVLGLGLSLVRPWARADTVTAASGSATPSAAPAAVAVGRSAFAANSMEASVVSPPMILTSAPATTTTLSSGAAPMRSGPDPFAGGPSVEPPQPPRTTAASPVWTLPTVPRLSAALRRRLARRTALPPLHLTALPLSGADGELAPAPVNVPNGVPLAVVAGIPQHTVVVNSLGMGISSDPASAPVSGSHIRITVRQSPAPDADSGMSSEGEGGSGTGAAGDVYQQRALSLQQSGDYGQARSAYQQAIRAYQSQIASGRDLETAQRGLTACQTGLQICQQSP